MSVLLKTQKSPVTINSADTYNFGDAGTGVIAVTVFSLVSSSFSGSITVKARATGTSDAFSAIPYRKYLLNGSAADGSLVTTAITDTSIIEVPSTGLDIALDCTSLVSGTMVVTVERANAMPNGTIPQLANSLVSDSDSVSTIATAVGPEIPYIIPPTVDPAVVGALWNNAGTLAISAG